MYQYRRKIIRLLIAGLFVSLSVEAQKIELGASLGGLLYKGDVSPALNPRFLSLGAGVFFRYNVSRSVSLRTGGAIGSFRAKDRFSNDPLLQARNYSFKSKINELFVDLEYNFFNYKPAPTAKNWTPYVFGGIGLCTFKNDYSGVAVTYPLGIGVKYEIKRPWSIGAELGTRFTKNDYLDGLGDVTVGPALAKTSQSNPALSDSYTYIALTLRYTFYKIVCP